MKSATSACILGAASDFAVDEAVLRGEAAWYLGAKTVLDILVAWLLLALSAPLILALMAAVKLTSRGPALYSQLRLGRGGREFWIYKLRTMVHDCERLTGPKWATAGDPRVTPFGRFLRRSHLDELPQLWNVLRGEMSLIGPRPTLRYQVERYDEKQRRRLDVRPGLTGWAQIHGRAELPWEERIELDVWYVEHRSPRLDLKILAKTPLALFSGTYRGATGGWRA